MNGDAHVVTIILWSMVGDDGWNIDEAGRRTATNVYQVQALPTGQQDSFTGITGLRQLVTTGHPHNNEPLLLTAVTRVMAMFDRTSTCG